MLPKAKPGTVAQTAQELPPESGIIALIETAAGVLDARTIAQHAGVLRLALGNIDLGAELGVDPDDHTALLAARSTLVLASAASSLTPPLDGVTTAVDDPQTLTNDVRHAVSLGLTGKLCIHPRQIDTTHQELSPTPDQIRHAQRVVAAAGDGGATVMDGKMLDKPVIDRARLTLSRARLVENPQ
jgi:citrate lyase subunit beta/citryl-CoA lyase